LRQTDHRDAVKYGSNCITGNDSAIVDLLNRFMWYVSWVSLYVYSVLKYFSIAVWGEKRLSPCYGACQHIEMRLLAPPHGASSGGGGADGVSIWLEVTNVLYMQSAAAEKGCFPAWWLSQGLRIAEYKQPISYKLPHTHIHIHTVSVRQFKFCLRCSDHCLV
jgi:hypothetical protein